MNAVTTQASGDVVTLYRVMCEREFQALMASGRFSARRGCLERVKWFAESIDHALMWGQWFERVDGTPHRRIVKIEVARELADRMQRQPRMDGIGPARCARISQLQGLLPQEVPHEPDH